MSCDVRACTGLSHSLLCGRLARGPGPQVKGEGQRGPKESFGESMHEQDCELAACPQQGWQGAGED